MKAKLIPVFFLFVLLLGSQAQAQKINQCQINYDVDITDTGEVDPMAAAMMKGMKMSLAFQGKSMHVEMDMTMGKTTIITNEATNKGVVLMNMMGQKMATPMDEADLAGNNEPLEDYEVKETGRTKKIAGHVCKEAKVISSDGKEYVIWYTEDIELDIENSGYSYSKINGFPLEMDIDQDGMTMRMTATSVSTEKMPASMFDTAIPSGYTVMDGAMMGK